MITIRQGVSNNSAVVTLTENVTLPVPIYMFFFTNITTKAVISFNKNVADDISGHPERYNEFIIDATPFFTANTSKMWQYEIYESADGVTPGTLLELGKMQLINNTAPTNTGYQTASTYTGYAG